MSLPGFYLDDFFKKRSSLKKRFFYWSYLSVISNQIQKHLNWINHDNVEQLKKCTEFGLQD